MVPRIGGILLCSLHVFLLALACRTAEAVDAYACLRVVREDPGFPSSPTITLPSGYSLVSYGDYSCASEAEYYVFVRGPKGTATGVTASWPGVRIGTVIWNRSRLALRSISSSRDRVTFDLPVQAASLRDAWTTFEVKSYLNESNLALRVEHNDQYRRAGWYADTPWVRGQAQAVINYLYASRLIMRDWGIHHRMAAANAGRMSLLGFESNDPLHFDYKPHLHIIMYLPTTRNAGTRVPHFYMDGLGRFYANKIQVLERSDLGDQYLYAGQPMTYVDRANKVWMAATIRSDGGLDLGPNAGTVAYSMVPDDASTGSVRSVRVLRKGVLWARVTASNDTTGGVITTRINFFDGVTAAQVSTTWYDPLTGAPRTSAYALRAAPTITSPDGAFAVVGRAFSYGIAATRTPSSFTVSGLPPGLRVDTSTGRITGVPTTAGEYRAVLRASNASGQGSAPLAIVVARTAGNALPAIETRVAASANPVSGGSTGFNVKASDDRGEAGLVYTWSASGPGTMSFTRSGSNAAKTTTGSATRTGLYVVTVKATDSGGLSARSSVNVQFNGSTTMASSTVSPTPASVARAGTQQFSATVLDQSGKPLASQPGVIWAVSGGGTIPTSGLFTAVTVTARSGSATGTARVTISAPTLSAITIDPPSATVSTSGSQQYTATARDQSGRPLNPQPTFAWSVSGGGRVSGSGLFTADSTPGTYSVAATSGARRGTATVTVAARGTLSLRVNFQTAATATVPGYLVDSGAPYAARSGQTYGWNAVVETRERNVNSDQRLDTLAVMQAVSNPNARWELAVPNGSYDVHVVCGDPSFFDGYFALLVEGAPAVTGRASSASPFREGTVTVQVTDGRLTVSNGIGSANTRICYIEIEQIPVSNG